MTASPQLHCLCPIDRARKFARILISLMRLCHLLETSHKRATLTPFFELALQIYPERGLTFKAANSVIAGTFASA